MKLNNTVSSPYRWRSGKLFPFKTFLTIALITCFNFSVISQTNDLDHKLMMGYQGWFLCKGDGAAPNEWRHWFNDLNDPSAEKVNIDMWPDMSEYSSTYATNMNYQDGTPAKLFSSHDESTVMTHFQWMKDYNIHGVYLQRFLGEAANDPRFFSVRNNVLQHVMKASQTHDRKFSIMYDISGVPDDGTLYDKLINDWEYLVNTYQVTQKSEYVKQKGLPVIAIWGIGFEKRGLKPETFEQIIDYFHNTADPKYRAYVVGGVPSQWRTLSGDSESDPRWLDIYHSLDMISPWTVGRYGDINGADNWKNQRIVPDLADCTNNGVDYMPVIFPGFSWNNMHHQNPDNPLNQIPRRGGEFYWRQAYNAISAGVKYVYVAMFDEVDEATAMFKIAPNKAATPSGVNFVTLDIDGQALPSDWYLQLANETQKMLDQSSPLSVTIPISPDNNNMPPVISSAGTATGKVGTAFSYQITATNTPVSYSATGLPSGLTINTSSGLISGTPTVAGTFNTFISATNAGGTGSKSITITISNVSTSTPYLGTPWIIPGTIQAENYDEGGEGVAYHDNDIVNSGGQQRTGEGVDVENTGDDSGVYNVGWTNAGEWLKYTVHVAATGPYTLQARVASPYSGKSFRVEMDGTTIATVNIPNTSGWQSYQTVSVAIPTIAAGSHTLRIYMITDGFNLNYLSFTSASSIPVISSANTSSGTVGATFAYQIVASNSPTSYGASGLPTGLSISSSTGLITGIPSTSGTFDVTVTATNAAGTGSKTVTVTISSVNSVTKYRIKNRWQNTYLYDGGDRVRYSTQASGDSYEWIIEEVEGGNIEIRNAATGDYMHIENLTGYIQCTSRSFGWTSSRWASEDAGSGYVRLRNLWQSNNYIHVENLQGHAQHGIIYPEWWSAQWILEPIATFQTLTTARMDFRTSDMNIYPNPSQGRSIIIEYNGHIDNSTVLFITDLSGNELYKHPLTERSFEISTDLTSGIYLLKIQSDRQLAIDKLIVR